MKRVFGVVILKRLLPKEDYMPGNVDMPNPVASIKNDFFNGCFRQTNFNNFSQIQNYSTRHDDFTQISFDFFNFDGGLIPD